MLGQPFALHALLAGLPIAAACGAVGYFVVLRAHVFAADALSHVAFTGAVAAGAMGVDPHLGLFAGTVAVAAGLGALGRDASTDDVPIGVAFSWILGLGVLALVLLNRGNGVGDGALGARTLFGSIFGLSAGASLVAAAVALGTLVIVAVIARPLLFASVDAAAAATRGVPVRALSLLLLALLGVVAAQATQAVGALLLLGLISAPAGAAQRLTANPYLGLGLSVLLAVLATAIGIVAGVVIPGLPPSTAIIAVAAGIYVLTLPLERARRHLQGDPAAA